MHVQREKNKTSCLVPLNVNLSKQTQKQTSQGIYNADANNSLDTTTCSTRSIGCLTRRIANIQTARVTLQVPLSFGLSKDARDWIWPFSSGSFLALDTVVVVGQNVLYGLVFRSCLFHIYILRLGYSRKGCALHTPSPQEKKKSLIFWDFKQCRTKCLELRDV